MNEGGIVTAVVQMIRAGASLQPQVKYPLIHLKEKNLVLEIGQRPSRAHTGVSLKEEKIKYK